MNVVQVPRRFVRTAWGGTETVILETSRRLLARGHSTWVLCPHALGEPGDDEVEGVPVRRVPYFYPYFGLRPAEKRQLDQKGGNMFSFALMRELRAARDLDLVHVHTANRIGGICRHVARRRSLPYVVSLHGGFHDVPDVELENLARPTSGRLEWGKVLGAWVGSRRVLADADAIVCVGEPEARATQARLPDRRVVYLPNGVDTARFARGDGTAFRRRHGISQGARLVLTIGRLDPQKNQALAVRVAAELRRELEDVHLVLVGPVTNDAYHARLVEDVRRLGLERHVTIIPGLPSSDGQLQDAYHAADVFLLPSVHEPFGIVILEAWAAGLPVVASRVGGIPAFATHASDALLFPSGDVPEATRSVLALLRDARLARSLAEQGARVARESYDWDRVTSRLIALYESVLEARKGAAPVRARETETAS